MASKTNSNNNSKNKNRNSYNRGTQKRSSQSGEPRKDSRDKRVNFDNTREAKFERDMRKCEANDISWWNKNAEMFSAATRISSSAVVGTKVSNDWNLNSQVADQSVPGILSIEYHPTIGGEWLQSDYVSKTSEIAPQTSLAINRSSESRISFVVHANSRNTSYSGSDQSMVLVAGADIFSMVQLGVRAFGLMRNFSPINYYTPEAVIAGCGFDPDDLKENYSHMWFDLNYRIAQCQQIWVPSDLTVTQRWFWLNQNVYTDGQTTKSQIYVFRPGSYLVYSDTKYDTGTSLVRKTLPSQMTWDYYLGVLDEMLDALINSLDRGVMFGDILKAYGASALYAMNPIPNDITVTPTYNAEVLTQIENLELVAGPPADIVQDESEVIHQLWDTQQFNTMTIATFAASNEHLLNYHFADPDGDAIMISTRLKPGSPVLARVAYPSGIMSPEATGQYDAVIPASYGTEVVTSISIISNKWDSLTGLRQLNVNQYRRGQWTTMDASLLTASAFLYEWNAFDWVPWLSNYTTSMATSTSKVPFWTPYGTSATTVHTGNNLEKINQLVGDWDWYTFVTDEEIRNLHLTALLSVFGMPIKI